MVELGSSALSTCWFSLESSPNRTVLVFAAGPSSPGRATTPQSRGSPVPPPPPPRPCSRPKLPPGKPLTDLVKLCLPVILWSVNVSSVVSFNVFVVFLVLSGFQTRSFSPPIAGSPPPFAPLARAESSSSLSSITIQSAASTPTLGKDLNTSTTGDPPAAPPGFLHPHVSLSCHSSSCPS